MTGIEPAKSAAAGNDPARGTTETKDSRVFMRIAAAGTALGLGGLAATVESLRGERDGLSFEFSAGTVAAFAIGAAVGFTYWALVTRGGRWAWWSSWLLAVAGVAAFIYPLRFVPVNGLTELAKGFVPAVLALSMVGGFLLGVKRFVDSDSEREKNGDVAGLGKK